MGNVPLHSVQEVNATVVIQKYIRTFFAQQEMKRRHRIQQARKKAAADVIRTAVLNFLPKWRAAHRIKALCRRYMDRKRFLQLKMRTKVVREIINTEENYVHALSLLVDKLYDPLIAKIQNGEEIISMDQIKGIFSHIKVIYLYNTSLLKQLQELLQRWSYMQCIGQVFLSMIDFFKVYIQYVNNFDNALNTINKCFKIDEFVNFLKKQGVTQYQLQSLIIQPIQRIPRYVLLLQNLATTTPSTHPDHQNINTALTRIKEIADLINQRKKEFDSFNELLQVNQLIEPPIKDLIEPRRLILRKGEVLLVVQDNTVLSPRPNANALSQESVMATTPFSLPSSINQIPSLISNANGNINLKKEARYLTLPLATSSTNMATSTLSTPSSLNPVTPRYIEYYYILFNDLFVLTTQDDNKLKMKLSLSLLNAVAILNASDNEVTLQLENKVGGITSEKKKYVLKLKSTEECNAFYAALNEAIINVNMSQTSFYKDRGAMKLVVEFVQQLKPLCSDSIQTMLRLENGNVWIGQGDGIISLWDNYNKVKELKSETDRLYVLLEVGENIWCSGGQKTIQVINKKTHETVKLLDAEKEVIKSMIVVNNDYQGESTVFPVENETTNTNQNNKSKKKQSKNSPQEYHTRLSLFITQQQLNSMKGGSNPRDSIFERTRNPFAQLIEDKPLFSSYNETRDVWSASCTEGLIIIWDIKRLAVKAKVRVAQGISAMVQYKNFVWLASVDGFIYVIHLETYEVCAFWRAHKGLINAMVLTQYDHIWTCSNDSTIAVWDAKTRKEVKRLECPGKCLCLTVAREHVWSGMWTKEIVIWDAKRLEFVQELRERHKDGVRSLLTINTNNVEVWSGGRELDCSVCVWRYINTSHRRSTDRKSVV